MNCNAKVSYTSQGGDIRGFEFSCDAAIQEAFGVKSHLKKEAFIILSCDEE